MVAFASSLDQCGPLTRTVADAALLLGVMQGRDPHDSTSVGIEGGIERPTRADLTGLRFGVARDFSHHAEGVEPGVAEVFERSLALIERLGGTLEEIELPNAEYGISAYYVIAPAEASSNLQRYDGVRYGIRETDGGLDAMYERTRARGFGDEVKRRIMLGTYALSSGYYEAYYGRAQKVRTRIAADFARAFGSVDLVVTPTSPSVAFKLGARTADPLAMYLSDYFTVPMSLAGIPAISVPAGDAPPPGGGPGLPVGLQLAAPAFAEQGLLEAAHALEAAVNYVPASSASAPGTAGSGTG
jgi:aspartyl-tRNA(Asn)/glutamyl-tRNA(Gln) amidotransferase subunit A